MSQEDFNAYLQAVLEKAQDWKIKVQNSDFTNTKKQDTLQKRIQHLEKDAKEFAHQLNNNDAIEDAHEKIESQLEQIKQSFRQQ